MKGDRNDMDALAEQTAASQRAIIDIVNFVERGRRAQAAVEHVIPTELRVAVHSLRPNTTVIEIWHNGDFIGEITPCDNGPGVRILSKYLKDTVLPEPMIMEVRIRK